MSEGERAHAASEGREVWRENQPMSEEEGGRARVILLEHTPAVRQGGGERVTPAGSSSGRRRAREKSANE